MPYIRKTQRYINPKPHNCELPVGPTITGVGASNVGPGSVWKCPVCSRYWYTVIQDSILNTCKWVATTVDELIEMNLL